MTTLAERRAEAGNSYTVFATEYFAHLFEACMSIDPMELDAFRVALEQIRGTIYIVANGGSAASAQHMANGLGAYLHRKRGRSFRVRALTENIAALTGQSNDGGFENVFIDQLIPAYQAGDALIAISCMGNSENIVRAARWVQNQGGTVIGMLGSDGGKLKDLCDIKIHVRASYIGEYGPIEDAHMAVAHSLVHWYEGMR